MDPTDETKCLDIDECSAAGNNVQSGDNSAAGNTGVNVDNSVAGNTGGNVDNSAAGNSAGCEQLCVNRPGGYECACRKG